MHKVTASFRLNTPLFAGGFGEMATSELTERAIKSQIQFWWRALVYAEMKGDIAAIRLRESKIFGGSDPKIGASTFKMMLRRGVPPIRTYNIGRPLTDDGSDNLRRLVGFGVRYLGYGLVRAFGKDGGLLERPCLGAPTEFTVTLLSRKMLDPSLIDAIKMFGLVGGLGSRARRGFGSISLKSLTPCDPTFTEPETAGEYISQVQSLLTKYNVGSVTSLLRYTAFSGERHCRIEILAHSNNAFDALNVVGDKMRLYRSAGQHWSLGPGRPSEKNFVDDHDFAKNPLAGRLAKTFHPERAVFGLPQNYGNFVLAPETNDRRASPLFIHIHRLGELPPDEIGLLEDPDPDAVAGGYIAVAILLPAEFLPAGEKLRFDKNPANYRNASTDWDLLTAKKDGRGFLDGKSGIFPEKTGSKYFKHKIRVWP